MLTAFWHGRRQQAGVGGLAFIMAMALAAAAHADVTNGSVTIEPAQVPDGSRITVELQSPTNKQFITQIRVFKNPSQSAIDSNSWPLTNMTGSITIQAEQDAVPVGTPFPVTVDLLNYGTGTFYFVTFAAGAAMVHDHIDVLPGSFAPLATNVHGIYGTNGALVKAFGAGGGGPTLAPGEIYVAAVNVAELKAFDNSLHVDFYNTSGSNMLRQDILEIKLVRNRGFDEQLSTTSGVTGTLINLADFSNGMTRVFFRTPDHQPYYEYDGKLKFRLRAAPYTNAGSTLVEHALWLDFNDSTARTAVASFAAYNQAAYPAQPWRNDYPFDRRHARLVRFGNVGLTNAAALADFARQLTNTFAQATKGYFELVIDGIHRYPLVRDANYAKITNWYAQVPKTPGKEILDVANPGELYLAGMVYYYNHDEAEFLADLQAAYPQAGNGEDVTIYLFDGPGDILGQAMGATGFRTKINRLYPATVFYTGIGGSRTYHKDLAIMPGWSNATAYLSWMDAIRDPVAEINTTVHELGHVYWLGPLGLNAADQSTKKFPFYNDTVYTDDSLGYFTRNEFMSYERNRSTLAGQSYGDNYLGQLLGACKGPVDKDQDGLPDLWETAWFNHTNQTGAADSDADGLANSNELACGTSPLAADSDGDGFSDLAEIAAAANPRLGSSYPLAGPAWWYTWGAVATNQPPRDFAAANRGQLKWFLARAGLAVSNALGGTAADVATNGYTSFGAVVAALPAGTNYAPVTLGQVKHHVTPLYHWLFNAGVTNAFPWGGGAATNDFAPANIGQLKHVFGFPLP